MPTRPGTAGSGCPRRSGRIGLGAQELRQFVDDQHEPRGVRGHRGRPGLAPIPGAHLEAESAGDDVLQPRLGAVVEQRERRDVRRRPGQLAGTDALGEVGQQVGLAAPVRPDEEHAASRVPRQRPPHGVQVCPHLVGQVVGFRDPRRRGGLLEPHHGGLNPDLHPLPDLHGVSPRRASYSSAARARNREGRARRPTDLPLRR